LIKFGARLSESDHGQSFVGEENQRKSLTVCAIQLTDFFTSSILLSIQSTNIATKFHPHSIAVFIKFSKESTIKTTVSLNIIFSNSNAAPQSQVKTATSKAQIFIIVFNK
jgi:hypothetical protein